MPDAFDAGYALLTIAVICVSMGIIGLFAISPVSAMPLLRAAGPDLHPVTHHPILNESGFIVDDPAYAIVPVDITVVAPTETPSYLYPIEKEQTGGIIGAILRFFGIGDKNVPIEISTGNEQLAVLPADSVFLDVPVSEECLRFQYGTDNWYQCEEAKV